MSKFIRYNHYENYINVNEIERIINPYSINNCYLILKDGTRLKYEFKVNVLDEIEDTNKIIQIIEPKEQFYNVYKEDENYIVFPVEYLGLTNDGEIIGIELDAFDGYTFKPYVASNFEFTTNKKGLKELEENNKTKEVIYYSYE